jgi:hypothetical protein
MYTVITGKRNNEKLFNLYIKIKNILPKFLIDYE